MISLVLYRIEAAISSYSYILNGRGNLEIDGVSTKFRDLGILDILSVNSTFIVSDFEDESDLLGAVNLDWELVLGKINLKIELSPIVMANSVYCIGIVEIRD